MTRGRRRIVPSQRGSLIVEAAVVMPILLTILLGAIDFGAWVFETTEAASSARDGARVGTFSYLQADVAGSSDAVAITNAVRRRMASHAISVAIHCVGPTDTVPLAGGCVTASIINPDRIQVTVTWPRSGLSYLSAPFGVTQTISASVAMDLAGLPTVVVAP